jgi:hypothetical protein
MLRLGEPKGYRSKGIMNIKRFIPVVLIAAFGLTVTACSGGTTAKPASTSNNNTPTTVPYLGGYPGGTPTQEQNFATDLAATGNPDFAKSPADALGTANAVCSYLGGSNTGSSRSGVGRCFPVTRP